MMRALGWLGKHATPVLAGGVFIGLALPDLAALARPLLVPAIVAMLVASILRVDPDSLRGANRDPWRIVPALAFLLLVCPVLCWLAAEGLGLTGGVRTALVVWAASPPLISVTAIAVIVGLDGGLALVLMALGGLIMPFTLPPIVFSLIDLDLPVSPLDLSLRLLALLAGSCIAALLIRRLAGRDRLAANRTAIDGAFVLVMLIFAVAVMDGVTAAAIAEPARVAALIALVFAVSLATQAVAWLVFLPGGRRQAATIALTAGNRNMAVVLGAAPAAFDSDTFLYLALLQFPIYLLPAVLRPVYRWSS